MIGTGSTRGITCDCRPSLNNKPHRPKSVRFSRPKNGFFSSSSYDCTHTRTPAGWLGRTIGVCQMRPGTSGDYREPLTSFRRRWATPPPTRIPQTVARSPDLYRPLLPMASTATPTSQCVLKRSHSSCLTSPRSVSLKGPLNNPLLLPPSQSPCLHTQTQMLTGIDRETSMTIRGSPSQI